jgi:hypothetical protein
MDLLVAVLLVNLLGGVVFASVANVRAAANRAQSSNNLKQITLATIDCADAHQGKVVPGRGNFFPTAMLTPNVGYGPCLFHILPYIEQDVLYKSSLVMVGTTPVYASWQGAENAIKVYLGPGDPTLEGASNHTSYLANGLALPRTSVRYPAFFADGTSNTIFYAEAYARAVGPQAEKVERRWWDDPTWTPSLTGAMFQVAPAPEAASARLPQGLSPTGLQVALGDGSVRIVNPACSSQTFFAACTPNAGDILGNDW